MRRTTLRTRCAGLLFAGLMALTSLATLATTPCAQAGDGPRLWSEEWYAERAADPPGSRQKEKYGKLWPPYPRPVGRKQPIKHKFHHNTYWPYPYTCADQQFIRSIEDQQAANGWITATTLHDYHFDQTTHELNSAGETQLAWILSAAPVQYRSVYIAQTFQPEVAQARLASVEQRSRELMPGSTAPIQLRYDSTLGRPAVEIDTLRRLEIRSMPQPRLFVIGAGSGGSGGMSSGSGSGSSQGQMQNSLGGSSGSGSGGTSGGSSGR